ncbi:MAG: YqaA family protein [Pseudomonadota bacterium]
MLKRLYDWTLSLAQHKRAPHWLAGISFIESSFFPIPPDVMLLPMCLARPKSALSYAAICTLASVAGALLGYAIGAVFYDTIGGPILAFYGYEEKFLEFQAIFAEHGWLMVAVFGLTFLPFKVITIASGLAGLPLLPFLLASIGSRGVRFFLIAALLWAFGARIASFIEKRFSLLVSVFTLLLVGGFVAIAFVL